MATYIPREASTQEKLTITLGHIRESLHQVIARYVGRFLALWAHPRSIGSNLESDYRRMAQDALREADAREWAEATVGDVRDEAR